MAFYTFSYLCSYSASTEQQKTAKTTSVYGQFRRVFLVVVAAAEAVLGVVVLEVVVVVRLTA